MKVKLLIYEFDCLNSLLLTDRKILRKVFSNIIVPRVAYYELRNRLNDEILQTINSLKRSKFIVLEDFEINTPEYQKELNVNVEENVNQQQSLLLYRII